MSVVCDLALAVGLTLNGLCAADVVEKPGFELPADDEAAYALPVAPVEVPKKKEPPRFPPIVIREAPPPPVIIEAPPPPSPPPPPQPDPLKTALERLYQSGPPVNVRRETRVIMAATRNEPLDFPMPVAEPKTPLGPPPMAKEADYAGDRRTSGYPVDNSRILTADRYITVVLETGINSQIGGGAAGTINVQSARDVFGYHGRNVLIPKGSRLICSYTSPDDFGSSRLAIECERILIAGHRAEIRNLNSLLADVQGRSGTSGEVDNRFAERYGTAFLLTGISTGVSLGAGLAASDSEDESTSLQSGLDAGAAELSERLGEISAGVLERTLELKPIITVPQGTRLQIRPRTDWYIAKMEDQE